MTRPLLQTLAALIVLVLGSALLPTHAVAQQGSFANQRLVSAQSAAQASDVINGVVLSTTTVDVDGDYRRVSQVAINHTLTGTATGTILVETMGGDLPDGTTIHVTHQPVFAAGDELQLALTAADEALADRVRAAMGSELDMYSVAGGSEGAYWIYGGSTQAASDYLLNGLSWTDFSPAIEYHINPTNSGVGVDATVAAVQRAFQAWEDDPLSAIDFAYAGRNSATTANLFDGQNSVSWIAGPAATSANTWIAQARFAFSGSTLVSFDVVVNTNFQWSDGPAVNRFDIETTVTHEVGHALGLGDLTHASGTTASEELMFFQIARNTIKKLGKGDLAGVRLLYPDDSVGLNCAGEPVTVDLNTGEGEMTEGRDVVLGTSGDDIIDSLGGDDIICGGEGDDEIIGGDGNDQVYGEGGDDKLFGRAGDDEMYGGPGADTLHGNRGNDRLDGGSGDDRVFGYADNDVITGGAGNDSLHGNRGDDDVRGGEGNDKVFGYADNDILIGDSGNDYIIGNFGNDSLSGGDGFDRLLGADGNDVIHGGAHNDILAGNSGSDSLNGGTGDDQLDGGISTDFCNGDLGSDSASRCESVMSVP